MKIQEYDLIVIGSGAAGLFAAYNTSKRNDFKGKILIVTKSPFGESNSRYAQGGIAAAISENKSDSAELHINDTLKSGAGLCDEGTVRYIIENSENTIKELVSLKAGFDKNNDGEFEYTLGGAHSTKRVLHSGEDATGMVMINALCDAVKNCSNIDIMLKTMAVEILISDNNECTGLVVFNNNTKEHEIILCSNIIVATGGCGQVYRYTTNPYGATGDGVALCYEAGLEVQDMEFVQFHPTALALSENIKNRYLITEALRGEGAKLVNNAGEEFMSRYSAQKELAQRDVVTRAIISEMGKETAENVFLDARGIEPAVLLRRFPSISKKCTQSGIDITKDLIPVAPAAHYMIGGVKAGINGQTSIKGLYVAGEAASTGFHGANRLASNSLLECVVCAKKLSEDIKFENDKNTSVDGIIEKYTLSQSADNNNYSDLKNKLKEIMWKYVGIMRSEDSLKEALKEIRVLKNTIEDKSVFSTLSGYEFRNMIIVSEFIAKSALMRKESRGAHFRTDYPNQQRDAVHTIINKGLK